MAIFVGFVVATLAIVALFETETLPTGGLSADKASEFVVLTVAELCAVALIPLALKLFKLKRVERQLTSPEALAKWGTVRLLMLCVPMLACCLLYYMYMNVAFGYLSIILFLCLFFVVPTMDRCRQEIEKDE